MSESSETPDWHDSRFDPYLLRVGRIAGMFAQLEFLLNQALAELANTEIGAMACITAQVISPGQRVRALASLIHYRGGESAMLKKINSFGSKVENLARQRNRYVHDTSWLVGNPPEAHLKRLHITADRKYEFEQRSIDLKEMDDLHQKIRASILEFDEIREAYLAELPAWPRNQYERSPKALRVVRGPASKIP